MKSSGPVLPEGSSYQKKHKFENVYPAIAGAISAACTRCICQPLDVLKIRFQLQVEPIRRSGSQLLTAKYTSIGQALRLIYKEESFFAFWKGHISGQLLSVTYGMSHFWTYEHLHTAAMQTSLRNYPNLANFLCGGLGGAFAVTLAQPFDIVRTRLIAQDHRSSVGYTGVRNAFVMIVRTQGFSGLYRGLSPALIQMPPMSGANLTLYKYFSSIIADVLDVPVVNVPIFFSFLSGGAAGTITKLIVYPLDAMKNRIQITGFETQRKTYGENIKCPGIVQCAQLTFLKEGLQGFYKGVSFAVLKAGLMSSFYYCLYDVLKNYLGKS